MEIRRVGAGPALVGLCLLVGACRPEVDAAPAVAEADSAGIPVVLNPAVPTDAPPAWRISAAPTLELGLADGPVEYLFDDAFEGARLSDGTIVVANGGTLDLRFYDSSGTHVRTVGREGDGPGEFRDVNLVGTFAGDSLLVLDVRLQRATVYAPDGTLARGYTLAEGSLAQEIGVLADGGPVLSRFYAREDETGVAREPRTVEVLGPDGLLRATVGTFPGREASIVIPPAGRVSMGVLFGRGVQYAAAGDRIVVGTTDAFSIRQYGPGGELVRLIRSEQPRTLVDPAEREEMFARLPRNGRGSLAQYQQQAIAAMPRYDTLPAFSDLRLDGGLNLWVREASGFSAQVARWQVFGPDGLFVARVELPVGIEILEIGEDYLLGNVRDDLGVQRIRLYALEKG
jgi:hypothetical protein